MFIAAAVGTLLTLPIPGRSALTDEISEIREMLRSIQGGDINNFLADTKTNKWTAPVIPSKWNVENVAPANQRGAGLAARDLGLAIAKSIDDWVPAVLVERGDRLHAKAQGLVDLAYWAGSTEGYGNLLIAARARDVAVVALGRLVADLEHPLDDVAALIRRCRAPFDALDLHARVLNTEAGASVLPADASVVVDPNRLALLFMLREAKNRWARQVERGGTRSGRQGLRGLQDDAYRWLQRRKLRGLISSELGLYPDKPDPHDPFFDDEECPRPVTLQTCWGVKRHWALVGSMLPPNLFRLETLLTFRETIGHFPLKVEKRSKRTPVPGVIYELDVVPEGQWAFSVAWKPYREPGTPDIGSAAWKVYDDIQAGRFLDKETKSTRLAERRSLARTPAVSPPEADPTPPRTP